MASSSNDTPAWEMSKENAAPLARGRNVESFEKSLQKSKSKDEQDEADRMKQRFERVIALDDTDDPLVHWLSYIKFHQDNYPSDTHSQFLLMERCSRTLMSNDKYRSDVRFIRVCVLYADKTDHPADVFKFLHQHKVGANVALFWTAWAWVAEQKNDYAFAEKLFIKGIAKEAQPLKVLEQRHKQFQARMSRHWLNESQKEDEDDDEQESGRATLGGLTKKQVLRNDRQAKPSASSRPQSSSRQATFVDRSAPRPPSTSDDNNGVAAAGGFAIFIDENTDPIDEAYNLNESRVEPIQKELESEAQRKKENTQEAESWNARGGYASRFVKTASRCVPAVPPAPSFEIHVDEECNAKRQEELDETKMQFDKGGRALQKREQEDVAEKLARDPTRYMKNPDKLKKDTKEDK
jgi:hypothetical protein